MNGKKTQTHTHTYARDILIGAVGEILLYILYTVYFCWGGDPRYGRGGAKGTDSVNQSCARLMIMHGRGEILSEHV